MKQLTLVFEIITNNNNDRYNTRISTPETSLSPHPSAINQLNIIKNMHHRKMLILVGDKIFGFIIGSTKWADNTCGVGGSESSPLYRSVRVELDIHLVWAAHYHSWLTTTTVFTQCHGCLIWAIEYLNIIIRAVLVRFQFKVFKIL